MSNVRWQARSPLARFAARTTLTTALALTICLVSGIAQANPARVTNGLVAYYPFTEGSGDTVSDHAGTGSPTDLTATGTYEWLAAENGIRITGGRIASPGVPTVWFPILPFLEALEATGQSTFEAWVNPENLTQGGPARILSLGRRFMLGQHQSDIQVKLQHTAKSSAGPWLTTQDGPLDGNLVHLVHTFDGTTETLYINGVPHPTTVVLSGDFTGLDNEGQLALGQEVRVWPEQLFEGYAWWGEVRTVAIYDRALTAQEVADNFAATPDAPRVNAGPDMATQGLPGQPTQSVTLNGSLFGATGVTAAWSVVSAPVGGNVAFGDASAPITTADFSVDGTYELRLTADDGSCTSQDDVTIDVNVLSTQITQPQNESPADSLVGASLNPTLEVLCDPAIAGGRFVIAEDSSFTTIAHDSGTSVNYGCSYVAFAGLPANTEYYWSARVLDDAGLWSDWSVPTRFTTTDGAIITSISLSEGEAGYTGASDADIRGDIDDPFNPISLWNQGAQDVIRAGRWPVGDVEILRSLLRFDVSAVGNPDAVVNAYLELTGWQHGAIEANFHFEAPHTFYELLLPWGEGTGITDPPANGEVTWLHSEYPTLWTFPGAGGLGTDRAATPLMRGGFTSQLGYKTYWSSDAFVAAVRGWMRNPSGNFGFLLQADEEAELRVLNLGSKETADPAYRPRLVIELSSGACADQVDNDGDGLTDLADGGCSSAGDPSERSTSFPCDDGLDNDGDGLADYPADPGCFEPGGQLEDPQCQDGINNDDDGLIDFDGGASAGLPPDQQTDPDPQCTYAWEGWETPGTGCGLGVELALLLPPLMWLSWRRQRS